MCTRMPLGTHAHACVHVHVHMRIKLLWLAKAKCNLPKLTINLGTPAFDCMPVRVCQMCACVNTRSKLWVRLCYLRCVPPACTRHVCVAPPTRAPLRVSARASR